MNTKRLFLIVGIFVISLSIVGVSFYFFKNLLPEIKKQKDEKNAAVSSWEPKISTDEWYWKKELPYSDVAEENIPEIIEAADNLISTKIGSEFFQKYVEYYPYQSGVSKSGTIYYLHYIVTIPEEEIDFKSTTHPVEIKLTINKDLSLIKPDQIDNLPDCNDINKCLNNINRNKAINAIIADMDKTDYRAQEILLDWSIYSMQWYMRYDLPNKKLPNCEFKMGGNVSIDFDPSNNKVIKRQESCNFQGV